MSTAPTYHVTTSCGGSITIPGHGTVEWEFAEGEHTPADGSPEARVLAEQLVPAGLAELVRGTPSIDAGPEPEPEPDAAPAKKKRTRAPKPETITAAAPDAGTPEGTDQ